MFARADHAAIGKAFGEAVRQLQGTELEQHHHLSVDLRDTGSDFIVTAERR
jgi:hypothetical protein